MFHFIAGSDYETGPYAVSFSAGQLSATLMVSTMDDKITEPLEDFRVHVVATTTGHPGTIEIGPPNAAVVTIVNNEQGSYMHILTVQHCVLIMIHGVDLKCLYCMHVYAWAYNVCIMQYECARTYIYCKMLTLYLADANFGPFAAVY